MMISWCIAPYAIDYRIDWLRVTDSNRRSGAYETPEIPLLQPAKLGAVTMNRTRDLLITSELLYQLSYDGELFGAPGGT